MKKAKNLSKKSEPTMGLSIVASLQNSSFFLKPFPRYRARQVGGNIIIYKHRITVPINKSLTEKQLKALSSVKFTGVMSSRTHKKIVQIVQNWDDTIQLMNDENYKKGVHKRIRINMLTLTLSKPQKDDDRVIKRYMLVPFIQALLRKDATLNYLWKAEKQDNGNIHFHLLIDRYFDKDWVRATWNRIQTNFNYHRFADYPNNEHGAPSTRIESLYDKRNAVSYIAKYISKSEQGKIVEGRLWGCNDELRELQPLEVQLTKHETQELVYNIAHSPKCIIDSENYMIITHIPYGLFSNYAEPTNYTFDMAVNRNKAVLRSKQGELYDDVESTYWFMDLRAEFDDISYQYAKANGLLYGLQEYVP